MLLGYFWAAAIAKLAIAFSRGIAWDNPFAELSAGTEVNQSISLLLRTITILVQMALLVISREGIILS